RQGVRLRPRRRGRLLRPELFPGRDGAAEVLRSERRGRRGADQGAPGSLGRTAEPPEVKPRGQPKKRQEPVPVALSPQEIALVRSLVIYEDPHIMALNKPSGLSSQGGR